MSAMVNTIDPNAKDPGCKALHNVEDTDSIYDLKSVIRGTIYT